MHIQVRVNEQGALRNQRYAFSDRYTLVSELLQNSRRAGATKVQVEYDQDTKTLRVIDDGDGIKDFQSLLVFHESGWDEDTLRRERPFGVGFSKCLYSASRCIVQSRGQFIDFRTTEALVKVPIEVHTAAGGDAPGTLVELHDVDLPNLSERIRPQCAGFPIDVTYNGQLLERPYAIDRTTMTLTSIGAIYLTGTLSGNYSTSTLVYLQGFRVLGPRQYSPGHVNIVHLDPDEFIARLPDRDRLIDEEDQIRRIDAEIGHHWRAIIEIAKYQLTSQMFVDRYYDAMRAFGHLDLLHDLDILPRGSCMAIRDYPVQDINSSDNILDASVDPPDRRNIESGQATLVNLDEVEDDNAAHWMFARAKGFLVFNEYMLDEAHWVHAKVRKLADELLGLETVGMHQRSHFDGSWISVDVVLCEALRLRIGSEVVEIADEGIYHGGTVFIPAGETSGNVIRQVSRYIDEQAQFRDYEFDADRNALADLLRRLRSIDPKDTLGSLLRPLKLEKYPVLHGKTFRLSIVGEANAHAIDLVG